MGLTSPSSSSRFFSPWSSLIAFSPSTGPNVTYAFSSSWFSQSFASSPSLSTRPDVTFPALLFQFSPSLSFVPFPSTRTGISLCITPWPSPLSESNFSGFDFWDFTSCFSLRLFLFFDPSSPHASNFLTYHDPSQMTLMSCWSSFSHYLLFHRLASFLPEASFGLRVLSSPASVGLCVRVCVCVCVAITSLSGR